MIKVDCHRLCAVPYFEFDEPIHDTEDLRKMLFDLFYAQEIVGTNFAVVMRYNYERDKNTEWWMKQPTIEYVDINLNNDEMWWHNDWDEGQTLIDIYGFFDLDALERYTDDIVKEDDNNEN